MSAKTDIDALEIFTKLRANETEYRRAATRGGSKRGQLPLNKSFAPLKFPACPPFPLRPLQESNFFFGDQQKTRRKVHQFGAMTFFFINRKLGEK